MKVFFINLQSKGTLVKTARGLIAGTVTPRKQAYLLEALQRNSEIQVFNIITKEGCTMIPAKWGIQNKVVAFLEFQYVKAKNGLKGIRAVIDKRKIKSEDIIIGFVGDPGMGTVFKEVSAKKLLHTNAVSDVAIEGIEQSWKLTGYISEVNLLKDSDYFKTYYGKYADRIWILPFGVQDRFRVTKSYQDRMKKAIATGTLTKSLSPDFIEYYGDDCLQVMRREIYEHAAELSDILTCRISPYLSKKIEKYASGDGVFQKLKKSYKNFKSVGLQKSYFSFDIVEEYNNYCFSVIPEETIGRPGIGSIESMACGCLFIGQDCKGYKDWGLVPGKHFAVYDGTVAGLRKTIEYYSRHIEEAERIAADGTEFVNQNLRASVIGERFVKMLLHDV